MILLSLSAIGVTTLLQARADAGRDAQLKLEELEGELTQLQNAPFKASPRTGGSPAFAGKLMDNGKRRIAVTLAELRHNSPVPSLARISGPLKANYAALDEIYAIGASGADYGRRANELSGIAGKEMGVITSALDEAGAEYDRAASATLFRSRTGSKLAILLLALAFAFFYLRAARLAAANYKEARTDALTGLPNRRALVDDLETQLPRAGGDRQVALALFDLDGFKHYNDTFGHPAGDALLTRLGERLAAAVAGHGDRLPHGRRRVLRAGAGRPRPTPPRSSRSPPTRSSEQRRRLRRSRASHGRVLCPSRRRRRPRRCDSPTSACTSTRRGRTSAGRQSTRRAAEDPQRAQHRAARAPRPASPTWPSATAERLGLPSTRSSGSRCAAELHDVGKTAIPDAILNKPGPLDDDEWEFMRRHTLIGERIILAAPVARARPPSSSARATSASTAPATPTRWPATRSRSAPRIIAVCDAFDAMVSERPYRSAMPRRRRARGAAPLRRHAVRPARRRRVQRVGRPSATRPCSQPSSGGLAEQALDEHAVLPLAVEAAVAALDADLLEAGGQVRGAARGVVGEQAAGELVEPGRLGGLAQRREQQPPDARGRAPRARRTPRARRRRRTRSGPSTARRARTRATTPSSLRRPETAGRVEPGRDLARLRRRVSNVATRSSIPSL